MALQVGVGECIAESQCDITPCLRCQRSRIYCAISDYHSHDECEWGALFLPGLIFPSRGADSRDGEINKKLISLDVLGDALAAPRMPCEACVHVIAVFRGANCTYHVWPCTRHGFREARTSPPHLARAAKLRRRCRGFLRQSNAKSAFRL